MHGCGDQDDLPHRGFSSFQPLLDRYKPDYMVHGHVHMNYGYNIPRVTEYGSTRIINAYEKYMLQI
jgi:Icc-related predicted phosphoesterase